MKGKKIPAIQNPVTGSYTVHFPKDARTGTFTSNPPKPGKIVVVRAPKPSATQ